MSAALPIRRGRVVIFSDEPGWHGRVLRRAFAELGFDSAFVSLAACGFEVEDGVPRPVIRGFEDGLPEGAFVRGVAGGTLEQVVLRLDVLHWLSALGIPVLNNGRVIECTVDKALTSLRLAAAGVATPATWVHEQRAAARARVTRELGAGHALVYKPLFGSQGDGVTRIDAIEDFDALEPPTGVWYLQRYVPRRRPPFRDWRIFVIDGRAVAGIQRASRHWVTNKAQGAECTAIRPNRALFRLAESAAAAVGADYAGVDVLRDPRGHWLVSEVNGIPAWQGLQRASGVRIAPLLASALVSRIERARARPSLPESA